MCLRGNTTKRLKSFLFLLAARHLLRVDAEPPISLGSAQIEGQVNSFEQPHTKAIAGKVLRPSQMSKDLSSRKRGRSRGPSNIVTVASDYLRCVSSWRLTS